MSSQGGGLLPAQCCGTLHRQIRCPTCGRENTIVLLVLNALITQQEQLGLQATSGPGRSTPDTNVSSYPNGRASFRKPDRIDTALELLVAKYCEQALVDANERLSSSVPSPSQPFPEAATPRMPATEAATKQHIDVENHSSSAMVSVQILDSEPAIAERARSSSTPVKLLLSTLPQLPVADSALGTTQKEQDQHSVASASNGKVLPQPQSTPPDHRRQLLNTIQNQSTPSGPRTNGTASATPKPKQNNRQQPNPNLVNRVPFQPGFHSQGRQGPGPNPHQSPLMWTHAQMPVLPPNQGNNGRQNQGRKGKKRGNQPPQQSNSQPQNNAGKRN